MSSILNATDQQVDSIDDDNEESQLLKTRASAWEYCLEIVSWTDMYNRLGIDALHEKRISYGVKLSQNFATCHSFISYVYYLYF